MERLPEPVVKNGKIVAKESDLLKPTTTPNGKVVVINPGHGGYSSRTGYFDPGSYSFIKKGNGKYAPLLEYDKMKDYGDDLAERLRAQGYAVVITSAHAQTVSDQKSMENIINCLHNGTKGGKNMQNQTLHLFRFTQIPTLANQEQVYALTPNSKMIPDLPKSLTII